MTVTRSGFDTTTGDQHQTSCLKKTLKELTSFSWAFFQLYFFLLNVPYSLKVYMLLATRFLIYTLEAITYYALIATLISNARSDVDPGFLVEMINVLLDCHPSVSENRMRRSVGQWNKTSIEDQDFLVLLQNFDDPGEVQQLTTTTETAIFPSDVSSFPSTIQPLTTDQPPATASILPLNSPWTAGPHWTYYTPPFSSSRESETTPLSKENSTFQSWLMDISNKTTTPPALLQEVDWMFHPAILWPFVALLIAFISGFLAGCILCYCRPTCVTKETTYIKQQCSCQEASNSKETWSTPPEALWTIQQTLPPAPALPAPACNTLLPPVHLEEQTHQLPVGHPTSNI